MLQDVLITGGTGFVGSAIARAVAEQHPKCTITVLDRNLPNATHALPEDIAFIQADITVPDELYKAFQQVRPQIVVHTAGIVPELSERFGRRLEQRAWKTNVEGTRNMLSAARESGVQAFVYTSTCCVVTDDMSMPYPNIDERWPASPSSLIYGESKVVIFSDSIEHGLFANENSELGCCGKSGSRSKQQHNGNLCPSTLRALWPWRPSAPSAYPRLHRQRGDPFCDR